LYGRAPRVVFHFPPVFPPFFPLATFVATRFTFSPPRLFTTRSAFMLSVPWLVPFSPLTPLAVRLRKSEKYPLHPFLISFFSSYRLVVFFSPFYGFFPGTLFPFFFSRRFYGSPSFPHAKPAISRADLYSCPPPPAKGSPVRLSQDAYPRLPKSPLKRGPREPSH